MTLGPVHAVGPEAGASVDSQANSGWDPMMECAARHSAAIVHGPTGEQATLAEMPVVVPSSRDAELEPGIASLVADSAGAAPPSPAVERYHPAGASSTPPTLDGFLDSLRLPSRSRSSPTHPCVTSSSSRPCLTFVTPTRRCKPRRSCSRSGGRFGTPCHRLLSALPSYLQGAALVIQARCDA